jgi:hypothetical protein
MKPDDDRDLELVESIRRHYTPRETTAADIEAFRRRLGDRLSPTNRRLFLVPALAAATLIALVGLWTLTPRVSVRPSALEVAERTEWERNVFFPPELTGAREREEFLPEELRAIATQLLSDSSM